jgi:hypothetical protein
MNYLDYVEVVHQLCTPDKNKGPIYSSNVSSELNYFWVSILASQGFENNILKQTVSLTSDKNILKETTVIFHQ